MKKVMMVNGERVEVSDEDSTRKTLLALSRTLGCETELRQIFSRYDGLLKNCKNQQEYKAISAMAVTEVSKLIDNGYLGKGGSVTIGGKKVVESKDDK